MSAQITGRYATSATWLSVAERISAEAEEAPRERTQARHTSQQMNPLQINIAGSRASAALGAARTAVVALTICAGLSGVAQAENFASIAPSLSPNRLHAKAALTFTMRFSGTQFGVPAPLSRSVVRLPAGMTLDIPHLSSCTVARLRARGPSGCPAKSALGRGHALVEVHAGTGNITEEADLWAFLGPPQNLQPTFEILAQGYTPIDERKVLTGSVLPASAPYGEELVMSIPPIPTLMLEPDASIATFSLTIGAGTRHGKRAANAVLTPSECPAGGLPFAAEFTYADGTVGVAQTTTPCPA
jgi:hypothetical protein